MTTFSRLAGRRFIAPAAVLAVAASATAVASGWSRATTAQSSATGWIAFQASHRGGVHGLYLMRADGSRLRRLTRGTHDAFPTWSPDGGRIAFVRSTITAGKATSDIFVVNADGSGLKRLVPDAESVAWSPDGRRIAFVRIVRDVENIFVATASDKSERSIATVPNFAGLAWAPAKKIAYAGATLDPQGNVSDNTFLAVMNDDGTGTTSLIKDADSPAWSPDGRRIAFVHTYTGAGGTGDTWIIAASGGAARRVTRSGEHPSWSPDGKKLVVGGVRSLTGGIGPGIQYDTLFVVNADGTKRTLLDPFGLKARVDASNPAWHS